MHILAKKYIKYRDQKYMLMNMVIFMSIFVDSVFEQPLLQNSDGTFAEFVEKNIC